MKSVHRRLMAVVKHLMASLADRQRSNVTAGRPGLSQASIFSLCHRPALRAAAAAAAATVLIAYRIAVARGRLASLLNSGRDWHIT